MPKRRVRSFLQTLEALGETAWHRNLETDEIIFTPAFWADLGYGPEEVPTRRRDFAKLIHPADLGRVQMESARFLSGENKVLDLEFRLRAKSKEWRWFLLRGREIQQKEEGTPHIAAGIITDVDDIRRGQLTALEDRERLTLAMNSSGAGFWELDLLTKELTLDEKSLEMHGLPADMKMPVDQSVWANAVDPEWRVSTRAAFDQSLEHGSVYSVEYSVGGGTRWINGLGKAIRNEEGQAIRFVGLNLDISDRKRSEQMIEAMRGELLHAARSSAMGAMAATLAHELNQPLTAMSNYATGLLRIASGDARLELAAKAVQDNAQRAGEIIRRMRGMARSGDIKTEEIKFDTLVQDAARYAKAGCEGISFHLHLNDGVSIVADAIQIQQVLINLIRNACQAMEETTSRERSLTITTQDLVDSVQVCVADTGPGIPEDLLTTVFDANFTTKREGMGIGLSISRTIVEAHGGKLWAESGPDGARFCFTLPVLNR